MDPRGNMTFVKLYTLIWQSYHLEIGLKTTERNKDIKQKKGKEISQIVVRSIKGGWSIPQIDIRSRQSCVKISIDY